MVKINSLQIENVKRVRAVELEPAQTGLTVIGGKNGEGKTSILDAIAWALGGNSYKPSQPERDGSNTPPYLRIVLSNGLIVERRGKNSELKVTDPTGRKAGQNLLDSFIEKLALDLPKFLNASAKEKATTLLQILGIGEQLAQLDREETTLYNRRLEVGRIADQKRKYADGLPNYPDAPTEPVSISELIKRQQDILAQNGMNRRLRESVSRLTYEKQQLESKIAELQAQLAEVSEKLELAAKSAEQCRDESTAEIEADIADIERINEKVRANAARQRAEADADEYSNNYAVLSDRIAEVRRKRMKLLDGANMPLEGLSVKDGELIYNGQMWDNMSGAEQLRVATSIVKCLNPQCGFVLLDRLEQMDTDTLREFGEWLQSVGLQAIATRVSTGDECSIIISDGVIEEPEPPKKWEGVTW